MRKWLSCLLVVVMLFVVCCPCLAEDNADDELGIFGDVADEMIESMEDLSVSNLYSTPFIGEKLTSTCYYDFDGRSVFICADMSTGWSVEFGHYTMFVYDGLNDGNNAVFMFGYCMDQENHDIMFTTEGDEMSVIDEFDGFIVYHSAPFAYCVKELFDGAYFVFAVDETYVPTGFDYKSVLDYFNVGLEIDDYDIDMSELMENIDG